MVDQKHWPRERFLCRQTFCSWSFMRLGRLLRADLIECWRFMLVIAPFASTRLFQLAPIVGTSGHAFQLAHIHCSLECQHHFFSSHIIISWSSLPSAVVELTDHSDSEAALKLFLDHKLYDFYLWPCKLIPQCTLQPTSLVTMFCCLLSLDRLVHWLVRPVGSLPDNVLKHGS